MVVARESFTLVTVGNTLVAAGGNGGRTVGVLSSVEIYQDGQVGGWKLAPWNLTSRRTEHCAVTLSSTEMILAGGTLTGSETRYSLVEKYNIQTGAVVALPNLPYEDFGLACALQGDRFIVSGGLINSYRVEMLDLTTLTWSSLPSHNEERRFHTFGLINGDLVVFGPETLEILNGSSWVTQPLPRTYIYHAMVLLPCPSA
jgi:hypothetical protein